jgi:hypothetical protein
MGERTMSTLNKLSQPEKESELWKKLEKILTERLEKHRRLNDTDQPESKTALLRGRIAEVKFLLALAKEPDPAIPSDADE